MFVEMSHFSFNKVWWETERRRRPIYEVLLPILSALMVTGLTKGGSFLPNRDRTRPPNKILHNVFLLSLIVSSPDKSA
jgi:hypothetical protein